MQSTYFSEVILCSTTYIDHFVAKCTLHYDDEDEDDDHDHDDHDDHADDTSA